jgi:cellulose synthase/poly-beta-1,6-N-acetylglucosamine synthase-like glycosyltransferase
MSSSIEIAFWLCLAVGFYPYIGYPLCVALLSVLRPRPVQSQAVTPRVTVVISAYDEARHIEATVRNKLEQQYPQELLDVIVASDASTDGTDELLDHLARENSRVTFVRQEQRGGKTAALNRLVERSRGEIIVFADANSMYRPDAIRTLVAAFADPQVGYATGRMLYVNPEGSLVGDGCTAYMKYENVLRGFETGVGSIVGVDGGVDAVRRLLYQSMRSDQLPDLVLPLTVVEQGYRVVFVPEAVVEERTLTTQTAEYQMRVRVALRAFWALRDKRALLNPVRYPLFSWQLASHKLLRYLSFVPLGTAAILDWFLAPQGWVYGALAAAQCCAVLLAYLALRGPGALRRIALARYCYYFLLLNWASGVAFVRFMRGERQVVWQPRTG